MSSNLSEECPHAEGGAGAGLVQHGGQGARPQEAAPRPRQQPRHRGQPPGTGQPARTRQLRPSKGDAVPVPGHI